MAFKMKRTPIKGLSDFFSKLKTDARDSYLYGKKATSDRKTKQKASNTGEYAGMTNFEKRRAEKKSRKPGESKFKADVRRRGETNKAKRASNKADAEYYGSAKDKAKNSEANKSKKTPPSTNNDKKKVSYADAYKNADKKKYPTLAEFTIAAKAYNSEKKKVKKPKVKKPKVKKTNSKVEVNKGGPNDINQDGIDDNIQGLTKNR